MVPFEKLQPLLPAFFERNIKEGADLRTLAKVFEAHLVKKEVEPSVLLKIFMDFIFQYVTISKIRDVATFACGLLTFPLLCEKYSKQFPMESLDRVKDDLKRIFLEKVLHELIFLILSDRRRFECMEK